PPPTPAAANPPPDRPATAAPPPPPPTPPAAAESVSAVKLWDAFDLDPTAAAAKYAGKVVEVRAHGRVAKDSLGRPYFGAEVVKPREGRPSARLSPEERRWEVEGYPPSVRCYLTPEQAAALEEVPAGREVVIRRTCVGRKDIQDGYRGH